MFGRLFNPIELPPRMPAELPTMATATATTMRRAGKKNNDEYVVSPERLHRAATSSSSSSVARQQNVNPSSLLRENQHQEGSAYIEQQGWDSMRLVQSFPSLSLGILAVTPSSNLHHPPAKLGRQWNTENTSQHNRMHNQMNHPVVLDNFCIWKTYGLEQTENVLNGALGDLRGDGEPALPVTLPADPGLRGDPLHPAAGPRLRLHALDEGEERGGRAGTLQTADAAQVGSGPPGPYPPAAARHDSQGAPRPRPAPGAAAAACGPGEGVLRSGEDALHKGCALMLRIYIHRHSLYSLLLEEINQVRTIDKREMKVLKERKMKFCHF